MRAHRFEIAIEGAGGCEGLARVSEVVPTVDPQSRSYVAKIDLPPAGGGEAVCALCGRECSAGPRLREGDRPVIAIPATAVRENGQLQSVFVVEDGRAHARIVTTGQRRGAEVAVLSGLQPGEKVVTPIPQLLTDGVLIASAPQ